MEHLLWIGLTVLMLAPVLIGQSFLGALAGLAGGALSIFAGERSARKAKSQFGRLQDQLRFMFDELDQVSEMGYDLTADQIMVALDNLRSGYGEARRGVADIGRQSRELIYDREAAALGAAGGSLSSRGMYNSSMLDAQQASITGATSRALGQSYQAEQQLGLGIDTAETEGSTNILMQLARLREQETAQNLQLGMAEAASLTDAQLAGWNAYSSALQAGYGGAGSILGLTAGMGAFDGLFGGGGGGGGGFTWPWASGEGAGARNAPWGGPVYGPPAA